MPISLTVKDASGRTIELKVAESSTGREVASLAANALRLAAGRYGLLHMEVGTELDEGRTLADAGVAAGDTLLVQAKAALDPFDLARRLRKGTVYMDEEVEEEIRKGDLHGWTELFRCAAMSLEKGEKIARVEDLEEMAPRAIEGAKDDDERELVFYDVGDHKIRSVIPELVRRLSDPDEEVRNKSIWTLADYGPEGIPHLLGALSSDDEEIRDEVVTALSDRALAPGGRAILPLLRDERPFVRVSAISALGAMHSLDVAGEVVPFLSDEDEDVRFEAGFFLGKPNLAAHAPAVIAYLTHESEEVRLEAADTLGEMKAPVAVEPLLQALKDSESSVRSAAVEALGKIGDRRTLPSVERLLSDESSVVQDSAAEAAAFLGSRKGVRILLERDEDVSLECLNALRQPELWARIQKGVLGRDIHGPRSEMWKEISAATGIKFDLPRKGLDASVEVWVWGGEFSIWECVQSTIRSSNHQLVLEPDRIRILPDAEARAFWQKWGR